MRFLIKESVGEVIFHPLEGSLFCNKCAHLALGIHVLHDLMQGRRHNVISVDPWPSQKEVVRSVRVYDIDCHLCLEVSNLAAELDLPHWSGTISIEPEDVGVSGIQSMGRNRQVLHDTSWHDAERAARVHLDARDLRGADVSREV